MVGMKVSLYVVYSKPMVNTSFPLAFKAKCLQRSMIVFRDLQWLVCLLQIGKPVTQSACFIAVVLLDTTQVPMQACVCTPIYNLVTDI